MPGPHRPVRDMHKPKKVALAYSGGLDTSVIIPWLKENYQCEVVAVCVARTLLRGGLALTGMTLFDNASLSGVMTLATSSSFLTAINDAGVRYVVVPKDIEGRFFMHEYKYSDILRQQVIKTLQDTALKQDINYSDVAVFENPSFTIMKSSVPDIVAKQQWFANFGFVVSVVSLVIFCIILVCR